MHTIKLQIEDKIYHNIMFLLENLSLDGLKIIEDKKVFLNDSEHDKWKHLDKIGKIGFHSKSFVDDDEDYSKW